MKIWVIEIYGEFGWNPTVGVGKTANEARKLLDDWMKINKFDEFRIKKYIRIERLLDWIIEDKNGIPICKRIPERRVSASVSN